MAAFTALLDASVLYPAPLRDFLLRLALAGLFRARWSSPIHDEWISALLRDRPDLTRERLTRTRALMDASVPEALVTDFENLIEDLNLPDPNDRHVLAAAVRTGAEVIVTANLRDFPTEQLERYGIGAQHPDRFIRDLIDSEADAVIAAAREQRDSLKNPPMAVEDFLRALERTGLSDTVAALRDHSSML